MGPSGSRESAQAAAQGLCTVLAFPRERQRGNKQQEPTVWGKEVRTTSCMHGCPEQVGRDLGLGREKGSKPRQPRAWWLVRGGQGSPRSIKVSLAFDRFWAVLLTIFPFASWRCGVGNTHHPLWPCAAT
ncbi:hypothetical protein PCL_03729 [Purpureocillium lilacinum]|uniref:Uncharacterized protein n=1 Tax=Purpureocillium lilacinum TaxID=33203 RepID=A0A2U3EPW5_PURLI|nr:hypothetical protein PCL_03729 [Purpureocillium lilacinum]